jgi:hypothetical protein
MQQLNFSADHARYLLPEMGDGAAAWAVMVFPVVTESRHGPELILGYLDAAWADCVVSVNRTRAFSYASHILTSISCALLKREGSLVRRHGS